MEITIPLKEVRKPDIHCMTVRDGGSKYLSVDGKTFCWINNQISSAYRDRIFLPYDHKEMGRELITVKKENLEQFTSQLNSILNQWEPNDEYQKKDKKYFLECCNQLRTEFETYYTPRPK